MTESEMAPYIKRIKKWARFQAIHQGWKSETIEDILAEILDEIIEGEKAEAHRERDEAIR